LLVLRHENAVLRRHADRVRYEPTDRVWFTALTRFIPRRRWARVFPVTPTTLLAWHRKLAARKYDTSKRRQPGLRSVLAEYQEHYNTARPHQGTGQRVPDAEHRAPRVIAADFGIRQIRRKPVLSGLINEYARAA
jgi:hypothetical protein